MYQKGQELLAKHTLDQILNGKKIQNELQGYQTIEMADHLKRSEDVLLQKEMSDEIFKAQKVLDQYYQVILD